MPVERMALDGFDPSHKEAFSGLSPALVEQATRAFDALARRWNVELVGTENLPCGGAVVVANHAFGFFDLALGVAKLRAETGRDVYSLGEHAWWRVPLVRRLAAGVGVVDGTQENADKLLQSGALVLVLPGGLREAMKPRELRYRLLWGRRYGFVRAAVRNQVPLVPLACIGGDDLFDLVGDAFARGRRWHLPIPIPRPARFLPIPHRTHLRFVVGEPIDVVGRGDENDEHTLHSLRHEVEGALHEMFEEELARRSAFPYGGDRTSRR